MTQIPACGAYKSGAYRKACNSPTCGKSEPRCSYKIVLTEKSVIKEKRFIQNIVPAGLLLNVEYLKDLHLGPLVCSLETCSNALPNLADLSYEVIHGKKSIPSTLRKGQSILSPAVAQLVINALYIIYVVVILFTNEQCGFKSHRLLRR